ncbi:MAG: sugar transferase [Thermoleophilia bacterium]|nr:sugar transferase [Thermoleophilia bacterium]
MSTHLALGPAPSHTHAIAAPTRRGRVATVSARVIEMLGACVAASAALAVLTDMTGAQVAFVAALVALAATGVIALSVPTAERGRSVLVRRFLFGRLAAMSMGLALALAVVDQQLDLAGLTVTGALLVSAAAVGAAWLVAVTMSRAFEDPCRVLVVGTGEVAQHLTSFLPHDRRFEIVGSVDDSRLPEGDAPVIGDIHDLGDVVREREVDLVVFSFVGSPDSDLQGAVHSCRAAGAQVAVVSRLFEGLHGSLSVRRLEGLPVVVAGSGRRDAGVEMAQRVTDILISGFLMLLTAPLWLALAVAIKVDSRGPVVYRGRRIGRYGEPFAMLKFRKMHDGAKGPALTMDNDDRFTRMGRFLAHSKLDELPQLWNVFKGDMSIVGPRPEDARYVNAHREAYDHVLTVRPGITGLSQIRYRKEFEHLVGDDFEAFYLSTLLPTKLAIDKYYVDHRSWMLDMKALLWTGVALLRGGELELSHLAGHVRFRKSRGRKAQADIAS